MGQKVSPLGLRIGITQNWRSRWFARKDYAKFLEEDMKVRRHIIGKLSRAGISRIEIERAGDRLKVDIHTARPGIVIGKKGAEVDYLRGDLEKISGRQVQINILEVRRAETDATLVAQNVAEQLQARVSFRRAMKRAVSSALKGGAKGIRIACAGRLGGSEMSRREWYREGRVPLHTLRADIDYGVHEAKTTFGQIGVKVWIYKGDILPTRPDEVREEARGLRSPKVEAARRAVVTEGTTITETIIMGPEEAATAATTEVAEPAAAEAVAAETAEAVVTETPAEAPAETEAEKTTKTAKETTTTKAAKETKARKTTAKTDSAAKKTSRAKKKTEGGE